MAAFRKRCSGGWQAQIRRKGYPPQSKSFPTRAAAVRWVRSIEFEMDQGLFMSRNEAETTAIGQLLNRYLKERTPHKRGAGPETCRIRTLVRHPLAKRIIGTVRGVDMASCRDERLQQVTPGSLRREMTILSQLFEVSRKELGINVHNPVRDVRLPPENSPRDCRLRDTQDESDGEETRLLAACQKCRNPSLFPIARLAIETAAPGPALPAEMTA